MKSFGEELDALDAELAAIEAKGSGAAARAACYQRREIARLRARIREEAIERLVADGIIPRDEAPPDSVVAARAHLRRTLVVLLVNLGVYRLVDALDGFLRRFPRFYARLSR